MLPSGLPKEGARPRLARRPRELSSKAILLMGTSVVLMAISLTVIGYTRCPYSDEWDEIAAIAQGKGPWSVSWLWSQHNEHRIATVRILIWLDTVAFGAKNISLFVETYLIQLLHWSAIYYAIGRFTHLPITLKRTLQGIFAFAMFNPNQTGNWTWAFQVSFFLPFAIATLALLGLTFLEQEKRRIPVLFYAAVAPLLAATNLVSGLLLAPVLLLAAHFKRLPGRVIGLLAVIFCATILLYFQGYRNPDPKHSPLHALSAPTNLLLYVANLLDATWLPIPHAVPIIAMSSLLYFGVRMHCALRNPRQTSNIEWFCLLECALILATAGLTALGRAHMGLEQAYQTRYQTPAMLYWACLFSLLLIRMSRSKPDQLKTAQRVILVTITLTPWIWFVPEWMAVSARGDAFRRACVIVVGRAVDHDAAQILYPHPEDQGFKRAVRFLRSRWNVDKTNEARTRASEIDVSMGR